MITKRKHKYQNIDKLFFYFLNAKKKNSGPIFINHNLITTFSILDILNMFVERGYLLHGSNKRLTYLLPFQFSKREGDVDRRRLIHATKYPFQSIIFSLDLLNVNGLKRNRSSIDAQLFNRKGYIYICNKNYFIQMPNNEFVSFQKITPDFIIRIRYNECRELFKINDLLPDDSISLEKIPNYIDKKNDIFFNSVKKVFLEHSRILKGQHGFQHAINTAYFAYIIAKCECPKLIRSVIAGAFLHDIGRVDNSSGNEHAIKGSVIAKKIIKDNWPKLMSKDVIFAIKHHADGTVVNNKAIGCIWDADRLDLIRLGGKVDFNLLSTSTAKIYAWILNAIVHEWRKRGFIYLIRS